MIGKTLSHYSILDRLGEGGMGIVYRAHDARLNRDVAIKILPRHVAARDEERKRFTIEAQAAAALSHPNIATIHAIEEADGELFIVMELVDGQELKEKTAEGPLPLGDAIRIARQIADGLLAAHRKAIIHRDIKSSNIMITRAGSVKIMDFGLARVGEGAQVTKADSTVGTAAYMSPEQARGEAVDHRSDLWSFGVVLYEMLAGRLPFETRYEHATIYSILNETPKPVTELRPDTPAPLAAIVLRLLAKDASARYQSAEDIIADLDALGPARAGGVVARPTLRARVRNPKFWIPGAVLLIALAVLVTWWVRREAERRWARQEALPEIERIIQDGTAADGQSAWRAFDLAARAEENIPDDPLLTRLLPRFSRTVRILSSPAGVEVFAKPYSLPSSPWRSIGRTPIDSVRFPLGFSRVKLEKAGSRTAYDLIWNAPFYSDTLRYRLEDSGAVPAEMETVPEDASWFNMISAPASLHMPGLEHFEAVDVGDFFMDRLEVTNREFKRFVEQGGYRTEKYWTHPVVRDGRRLAWSEAMKLFTDRTGQPGPSTWEVGDFPAGREDYPVTGVSWYEAAAYAGFAGKSLPTIYHWDRVAFAWASPVIVPLSNLRGEAPRPVGSSEAMNRFGVHDMGGNAREWCFNQTNRGDRFILGGGWNDPAYSFNDAYAQSPLNRTETNGFRCIRYGRNGAPQASLEREVVLPFRDFLREPRVPDATYALYASQYSYDQTPLDATVEAVTDEAEWTKEKVSFVAGYGRERMAAYLFLPKKGKPPFQTVVYFPGSGAIHTRSSENLEYARVDFFLKSGRAVIYPIYKSTYERGDELHSDYPTATNFWKDHVIMWAKDCSRSIDYLETRPEIDRTKIAYFGVSWGGAMGGIVPAVEKRIKVNVLLVAGLLFQRALPEAEAIHFLPRITSPVLMLNGKYDFFFPYETSQRPFFELLGTPKSDKRLIVYEGGHSVPRTQLVKEALAWLDRYLGPTE
jgi:tRNA A-37 threonylcarbamoyl transferase component Bud32/dienelactone hydrolase